MTVLHEALQQLIDREATKANTRGVLLAVQSGDGGIAFQGGAGNATPDQTFCIASITKIFTATLIMQLIDTGKLALDTKVQSILPDYDLSDLHIVEGIAFGPKLTIRHLLHQTSGLADYYEGGLAEVIRRGEDQAYDLKDVLRITKTLAPQGKPDSGKSYYSDTNYQLLGAVIEAVAEQPFGDVLQSQICAPLKLGQTTLFEVANKTLQAPLALYHKSRQINSPLALSSMGPDGGITSSLDDVLTFLQAYNRCELFAQENVPAMRNWTPLFFPLQYGFGLMRFKLPRWMNLFRETPELIGHSGSSGSFAFYAPRQDIYLVGTFNQIDVPQRPFGFMMRALRTLKKHGKEI